MRTPNSMTLFYNASLLSGPLDFLKCMNSWCTVSLYSFFPQYVINAENLISSWSVTAKHTIFHFPLFKSFQRIRPSPRPCVTFCNKLFFLWQGVVSPMPNPRKRTTTFQCPRLLIQYIRSYPPYLEAVSSIHNLKTRHAVVTRTHLTWPVALYG
jgi:hypothetical protein